MSVSDADREISNSGSTDNARYLVNSVSGMIRYPRVRISRSASETDDRFYLCATVFSQENLNSCGGMLHTPGTIRPPKMVGYSMYDMNVDCLWIVVAAENEVIRLKMDYYYIEDSDDCRNDALWVGKIHVFFLHSN